MRGGPFLLLALVLFSSCSEATVYDWVGTFSAGSNDDPNNWSPFGIPGAADDIRINVIIPIYLNSNMTVRSLTVGNAIVTDSTIDQGSTNNTLMVSDNFVIGGGYAIDIRPASWLTINSDTVNSAHPVLHMDYSGFEFPESDTDAFAFFGAASELNVNGFIRWTSTSSGVLPWYSVDGELRFNSDGGDTAGLDNVFFRIVAVTAGDCMMTFDETLTVLGHSVIETHSCVHNWFITNDNPITGVDSTSSVLFNIMDTNKNAAVSVEGSGDYYGTQVITMAASFNTTASLGFRKGHFHLHAVNVLTDGSGLALLDAQLFTYGAPWNSTFPSLGLDDAEARWSNVGYGVSTDPGAATVVSGPILLANRVVIPALGTATSSWGDGTVLETPIYIPSDSTTHILRFRGDALPNPTAKPLLKLFLESSAMTVFRDQGADWPLSVGLDYDVQVIVTGRARFVGGDWVLIGRILGNTHPIQIASGATLEFRQSPYFEWVTGSIGIAINGTLDVTSFGSTIIRNPDCNGGTISTTAGDLVLLGQLSLSGGCTVDGSGGSFVMSITGSIYVNPGESLTLAGGFSNNGGTVILDRNTTLTFASTSVATSSSNLNVNMMDDSLLIFDDVNCESTCLWSNLIVGLRSGFSVSGPPPEVHIMVSSTTEASAAGLDNAAFWIDGGNQWLDGSWLPVVRFLGSGVTARGSSWDFGAAIVNMTETSGNIRQFCSGTCGNMFLRDAMDIVTPFNHTLGALSLVRDASTGRAGLLASEGNVLTLEALTVQDSTVAIGPNSELTVNGPITLKADALIGVDDTSAVDASTVNMDSRSGETLWSGGSLNIGTLNMVGASTSYFTFMDLTLRSTVVATASTSNEAPTLHVVNSTLTIADGLHLTGFEIPPDGAADPVFPVMFITNSYMSMPIASTGPVSFQDGWFVAFVNSHIDWPAGFAVATFAQESDAGTALFQLTGSSTATFYGGADSYFLGAAPLSGFQTGEFTLWGVCDGPCIFFEDVGGVPFTTGEFAFSYNGGFGQFLASGDTNRTATYYGGATLTPDDSLVRGNVSAPYLGFAVFDGAAYVPEEVSRWGFFSLGADGTLVADLSADDRNNTVTVTSFAVATGRANIHLNIALSRFGLGQEYVFASYLDETFAVDELGVATASSELDYGFKSTSLPTNVGLNEETQAGVITVASPGCVPGQFGNGTNCANCPPGSFSASENSLQCTPCSAPLVAKTQNAAECVPCDDGETYESPSTCSECPIGTFRDAAEDIVECSPCPPGTSQIEAGSAFCTDCDPGFFAPEGSFFCAPCPSVGYTPDPGTEECESCPLFTEIPDEDGVENLSQDQCVCQNGYYHPEGLAGEICTPCPEGGVCLGGTSLPTAEAGFFKIPGTVDEIVACKPASACEIGNLCATNFDGILCAGCVEDYYRVGDECVECSSSNWQFWVAIVALGILSVGLIYFGRTARSYFAPVSIAFSFVQVVALMSLFRLNWPTQVVSLFSLLSVFNLNVDFLAAECQVPNFDWMAKWAMTMAVPVLVGLMLLLTWILCRLGMWLTSGSRTWLRADKDKLTDLVYNAFLTFLVLVYVVVAQTSLAYFDCTELGLERLLDSDPSIVCGEGLHGDLQPLAIAIAVIYVGGIPLFLGRAVYKHRSQINLGRYQTRYNFLLSRYQARWLNWELVIMARKLAFVGAKVFFTTRPLVGTIIALAVLLIAIQAQMSAMPFAIDRHNNMEVAYLWASVLVLFLGLLFFTDKFSGSTDLAVLTWIAYGLLLVALVIIPISLIWEMRMIYKDKKGDLTVRKIRQAQKAVPTTDQALFITGASTQQWLVRAHGGDVQKWTTGFKEGLIATAPGERQAFIDNAQMMIDALSEMVQIAPTTEAKPVAPKATWRKTLGIDGLMGVDLSDVIPPDNNNESPKGSVGGGSASAALNGQFSPVIGSPMVSSSPPGPSNMMMGGPPGRAPPSKPARPPPKRQSNTPAPPGPPPGGPGGQGGYYGGDGYGQNNWG